MGEIKKYRISYSNLNQSSLAFWRYINGNVLEKKRNNAYQHVAGESQVRTQVWRFGLLLVNDSNKPNIVRSAIHSLHIRLNVASKSYW